MATDKVKQGFSRRSLILGAGAAAAATTLPFSTAIAHPSQIDLADPVQALTAFTKLRGSIKTETVYQVYRGDVFLSLDGHVQAPLVGFRGLQKANWYHDDTGSYRSVDYDLGLYLDPQTRKILDHWDNPLTGKTVKTIHYRSGPARGAHNLVKGDEGTYGSFSRGWQVTGDKIEHQSGAWRERANTILPPKEYPLGSSGERFFFSTSYTMMGRMSEVADPSVVKAPCSYVWTMLAPWPPWMEMGQRPGYVLWRWIGHKVMHKSQIDPALIDAVENVWPNYVADDYPWEEESSGWHQYKWMKDGHKPG